MIWRPEGGLPAPVAEPIFEVFCFRRFTALARTGILVIDLRRGDTSNWVRLSGVVTDLYDVAVLPAGGTPDAARISERRGVAYRLGQDGGRGVGSQ